MAQNFEIKILLQLFECGQVSVLLSHPRDMIVVGSSLAIIVSGPIIVYTLFE